MISSYFEPAGKQEAIAATLGLSYSTYRRYLSAATSRLVDALWAAERAARARAVTDSANTPRPGSAGSSAERGGPDS